MALPVRAAPGTIHWIAVSSSWVARIGWQPTPGSNYGTLYLEAKSKGGPITGQYAYYSVGRLIWQQFQSAESKGKAYHALLKGRYGESKVG
jgi:hypothetical protein